MPFARRLLFAALCFLVILQFCYSDDVDAKPSKKRDKFIPKKLAEKGTNLRAKGARFAQAAKNDVLTMRRNATAELEEFYVNHRTSEALKRAPAALVGKVFKTSRDIGKKLKDSMRSDNVEGSKHVAAQ